LLPTTSTPWLLELVPLPPPVPVIETKPPPDVIVPNDEGEDCEIQIP